MSSRSPRRTAIYFISGALLAVCCSIMAACVAGSGAIGGGNLPPKVVFRILGTKGTPFSAIVTDTAASWQVIGSIPQSIVILNNQPPARIFASKLTGDSSVLSVEVLTFGIVDSVSATTDPFGTVVAQTARGLTAVAPAASPDTRFYVKGAPGDFYNGLIEDLNRGFELNDIAPTVFLFENPDGPVDGYFNLSGFYFGLLYVDLVVNGQIIARAQGVPSVQVK